MKRFIIVDFYDDYPEVIGRTDNEKEANKIQDERYDDTDGKADVDIYDVENAVDYFFAKGHGFLNSH